MIYWINGAFGAGKTQTAYELHRRLPGSFVFDPENVGYFLRKNMPAAMRTADFQDHPLWREFSYRLLRDMASRDTDMPFLVPMTVVNPLFFDEIVGRLRADGIEVQFATLSVSDAELRRRLRKRGEGSNAWSVQQIDRCVRGLASPCFQPFIETDRMTIREVTEHLAERWGLHLLPDQSGPLRRWLRRRLVQLRHFRL